MYLKDENKLDEMVDILHELHRYVPAKSETKEIPVPDGTEVWPLSEIVAYYLVAIS